MNPNLSNLPPQLQQRLAEIMAGGGGFPPETPHQASIAQPPQQATPPVAPPTPPAPKVSLLDHIILLRQEVDMMNHQLAANSRVVEAVGNAVGELYAMFQATPATSNPPSPGSTSFGAQFVAQQASEEDY